MRARNLFPLCLTVAASSAVAAPVDFAREIQPIFQASCYSCHGARTQMGGLRLDRPLAGASAKIVTAHRGAASPLVLRLVGAGNKNRMPLGGDPLSKDQIRLIRRWIDEGASWISGRSTPVHWAYRKPVRPVPPRTRLQGWAKNPIDQFVLARLEKEGMHPSSPAARGALIRRVTLDLIGLPPTPEEVDAFLADRRPDAYERVVDRLLASPHYGERWARMWLDLARYADTNGYEKDSRRTIWPYRDWVIKSLNDDLSFRDFTIQQLAGDLLPGATEAQRVATGFHRNTMYNDEGGVDRDEQRWLTLVDRVGTTASVWLGSTLACAQCHDHKYDPFKQKDFYAMLAFFETSDEPELKLADGTTTLVLKERPGTAIPSTLLRIKGSFLNPGEKVEAGVPSFLPPLKPGEPLTRLGLARWLVDPDNPLTARVTVNRIFEQYFGRGLVETSEDFGTMGERPTHPELLDWLATEFVRRGWSLKAIHRLIVTSSTYQQSSRITPESLERDPYNRLLARGPRFRMEAEMIRDAALAVSGELSPKIGGPSVFPPQPEGIWSIPYSSDQWTTSSGKDRYRRGIYTFWRRTAPYPAFVTFDATSREFCTLRRIRTDTPLQALTTLNDEAFFTSARDLARRMAREGGDGTAQRLAFGFRLCTTRRPSAREMNALVGLYSRERLHYSLDTHASDQIMAEKGADPALAALCVVANVLLNLDETLSKE